MRSEDEILGQLRAHRPFKEIRTQSHSVSKLYEAGRQYLDELDVAVEGKRARISKLEEERSDLEVKVQGLREEAQALSNEIAAMRAEKQQLALEVERLEERKRILQNEITGLQENGYTSDILSKIRSVEPRSGRQLWADVKRASQRHQLRAEIQALKTKKTPLEHEVKELEDRKKEEMELVRSEENRLDDMRLQAQAAGEAVSTVEMFFKDGWSAEDLKSLRLGLNLLGLKHEPRASINRLLRALEEAKTLASLSEKVKRKREELTTLNEACAKAKADSQILQTVTVKAIEEARNVSVKAIATTAEHGKTVTEAGTSNLQRLIAKISAEIRAQAQQTIGNLKTDLEKWREFQQEKARLEPFLVPARVLLGIIECPDHLNSIPVPMVVQLFERL